MVKLWIWKPYTLTIKRTYFDAILSGEKKQEFREIKPTTKNWYCEFNEKGKLIGPKQYDTLMIYHGYEKGRDWLEVEVTSAVIDYDEITYNLGEILNKKVVAEKAVSVTD